ncbi:hypothetical protein [Leptospira bouyouniensis]|uniref:hypothetical protein n=1 Tax=Leptospira bouyouniensis TaxID=2484911 RepID=UPI001FC9BD4B|nr:hypothetical protein [Leptospira bouyouniensis]
MENNKDSHICPNCGHSWYNKDNSLLYQAKLARGRRLPSELIRRAKIKEGKNTLRAIAKAYGIHQSHLSAVISGKRNTKHLIEILESEYRMSISELREIVSEKNKTLDEAVAIYKNQKEELDESQIRI